MKLEKILDKLNTIEKTSFSKIIDKIINNRPYNYREIDKILSNYSDKNLRSLDSNLFAKIFFFIEIEYYSFLSKEIDNKVSQLDILIDILIKDGNCIISREWLGTLYNREIRKLKTKIKSIQSNILSKDLSECTGRDRDFILYQNCLKTAYTNDLDNNLDPKITSDEKSILNTLSTTLDLSQEEVKLLNYSTLPLKKLDLEEIIELLKNTGIILYSKKNLTLYIPDEFIRLLRRYRKKEVADKYLRRILKLLKDSEINNICKIHSIDRKLDKRGKIKAIINEGVGIRNILKFDIYKKETNVTTRKSRVNTIVDKGLNLNHLKGTTIDQKIDSLVTYFNEIERDEKVGISHEGYKKLLLDLEETNRKFRALIQNEYEIQTEDVMDSALLLDYNLKPRDVLETLTDEEIRQFCDRNSISTRGNEIINILNNYKDSQNIELENYSDIAFRNLINLKENGIKIREADLGIKFEELTKQIFTDLGFKVNEELRKSINTSKDKMDILISISESDVILIECKSIKESGYNKFSSVTRQIGAYKKALESKGLRVLKSLLIAPEFTDEFINDVDMNFDLNLSLISASTLIQILHAFNNNTKLKELPYMLFMRDVVIQEERIIKALNK